MKDFKTKARKSRRGENIGSTKKFLKNLLTNKNRYDILISEIEKGGFDYDYPQGKSK